MSDCVFCAVLRGEAPASVVHEDELAVAFLDLFPIQAGHTLVVPREHVRDLSSCPPDLAAHLFAVSTSLAPAIAHANDAPAFNVWTANGRAAGQEVFHLHLHILPRHQDDSFGLRFPQGYPSEAARTELDEMARRIRQAARR
jgi:histidine triad (HIT) family protein